MPEILEVERLRRQLLPSWVGRKVQKIRAPRSSPNPTKYLKGSWEVFRSVTKERSIVDIQRYGKHLWVKLEEGAWQIHLGSTGWFYPATANVEGRENFLHAPGSARMFLTLDDGQQWNYHDPRTWGAWYLRETTDIEAEPYFRDYGPDWLLQPGHAAEAILDAKARRTVKEVLCDQHISAGLGNYLSVEACAIAGIHPHQPFNLLDRTTRQGVVEAVKEMLQLSSESETREHWRVFNKAGQPCRTCGTLISYVKDKGGSRGSYFCNVCQPTRK